MRSLLFVVRTLEMSLFECHFYFKIIILCYIPCNSCNQQYIEYILKVTCDTNTICDCTNVSRQTLKLPKYISVRYASDSLQ